MMNSTHRNPYWDNLKGGAILLVICGHLCERYINESYLLRHIWILIYSFHMPLFVFINGYFARRSSKPSEKKSLKMLGYYLMMQFLFMMGNYLIQGQEFEIRILASPAYCCWYLLFLSYAYLFAKILPKESNKLAKWILVSIGLSLLIGLDVSVGHEYGVGRTFYFLPYFFMGALWADKVKMLNSVKTARKYIYTVVGVLIFAVLWKLGDISWFNRSVFSGLKSYKQLYPEHLWFAFFNKMCAYGVAVVLIYIILSLAPRHKTILCFFGRHTMLIYLVHIFVFPMEFYLIQGWQFVEIKELNSLIILLILVATSAIICYIFFIIYRLVIANFVKKVKK